MVSIEQADDKEDGRWKKYCLLAIPLRILNADHLLPLDLSGEGSNSPQFGVIHDLLTSPHEIGILLSERSQYKAKKQKNPFGVVFRARDKPVQYYRGNGLVSQPGAFLELSPQLR